MRRILLGVASVAVVAVSCGPASPAPDASLSLQAADRIASVGKSQDWYGLVRLVDGRPDATWTGGRPTGYVQVIVASGVDPNSPMVARACLAILDAVDNPRYGPSLNVTAVILVNNNLQHECLPGAGTGSPPGSP